MTYYKIHKFLKISFFILFLLFGVKNSFAFTDLGLSNAITKIVYSHNSSTGNVVCGGGPKSYDTYNTTGGSAVDCNGYFNNFDMQFVNFRNRSVVTHSECDSTGNYIVNNYTERSITCKETCSIEISDKFTEVKGIYENCQQKLNDLGYDSSNAACGCPTVIDPVTKNKLYVDPNFIPAVCSDNSTNNNGVCECNVNFVDVNGVCLSDSDGDGCQDGYSKDIAGVCFADADGDGIPDSVDDDTNTDKKCIGKNVNDRLYLAPDNTLLHMSDFDYLSRVVKGKCLDYLTRSDIDAVYALGDNSSTCPDEYCYIHYLSGDCWKLNRQDYYPSSNFQYSNAANSQSACDALVTGGDAQSSTFVTPDTIKCPDTGFCYFVPMSDTNNDGNTTVGDNKFDDNVSSSATDLQPLLDAQNENNKILQQLKDDYNSKTDTTNKTLSENGQTQLDMLDQLKILANKTDYSKQISDKTSITNDKLGDIQRNGAIANQNLLNIDKSVKDFHEDMNSFLDVSDSQNSEAESGYSTITEFMNNLQTDLGQMQDTYNSTKGILEGGFTYSAPAGASPVFETTALGTPLKFDLCPTFSIYRPILEFIFTLFFMFMAIRIFFYGMRV